MQVLREDVEAALAEASLAQERAALLGLEQEELQRQRDQLAGRYCAVCAVSLGRAGRWVMCCAVPCVRWQWDQVAGMCCRPLMGPCVAVPGSEAFCVSAIHSCTCAMRAIHTEMYARGRGRIRWLFTGQGVTKPATYHRAPIKWAANSHNLQQLHFSRLFVAQCMLQFTAGVTRSTIKASCLLTNGSCQPAFNMHSCVDRRIHSTCTLRKACTLSLHTHTPATLCQQAPVHAVAMSYCKSIACMCALADAHNRCLDPCRALRQCCRAACCSSGAGYSWATN